MEFTIAAVIIAVALLVTVFFMSRQISKLTSDLNHKIEEDNHRTQDKIDQMNEAVNRKIDNNNARIQDSVTKQLTESRHQMQASNKVISEISERLGSITETNKHVVSVADELKTLQAVLQNPKLQYTDYQKLLTECPRQFFQKARQSS